MRCQGGDRAALEALLDSYRPRIYALVRRKRQDPEWVEDTVGEVLAQVCRSLGSFRWDSSVSTWIHGVAQRVCAGELRRARRQEALLYLPAIEAAEEEDPVRIALEREQQRCALRAAAELPAKYRTVILLRYVYGCSCREVADLLHVPVGTVKTWGSQGVRRMQRRVSYGDGRAIAGRLV